VTTTTPTPSSSRALRGALLLLAAMVLATVTGLVLGRAAMPLAISDPGPIVRWGLPLVRGITDIAMATSIGSLVMAVFAAGNGTWQLRRLLNLASLAASVWATFGILTTVFTYLSVTGLAFSASDSFGAGVWMFVTQIALGQSLALNVASAAATSVLALVFTQLRGSLVTTAAAFAGIIPLAVSGHAAGTNGHSMAVNALGLHLVGVSIWVGGLIALLSLGKSGDEDETRSIVKRYSSLALFAYAIVALSGIASASVRLQSLAELLTPYGQIVVLKSLILLALGGFGAWYRVRLIGAKLVSFFKLAVVETALMGAAMGLATALARTAPPERSVDLSNPTPAQILTGEKLPPELTPLRWITEYKIDLIWLLVAVFGITFYVWGVAKLRSRGDSWPVIRTISWVSGLVLLAWITNGSMNVYEGYLFSVHMIAHMALTMAVPLLLVPGAPVTLLSRAVAKRQDESRGVREWVLWAVHTPYARFISHPYVAGINFASSLVIFYFTPLFGFAARDHLGHEWMIVHFLITGYLFVQSLVGIDPGPKAMNYPVRLILLLGTLTFHALFGLSLMQGNGLLLADWYGALGRTWGQPPLMDQQTGGAIAWGIGEFPAAFLTLMVSVQWARSDSRDAKRLDRASDRSGNQDLEAYNQMLEQIARRSAAAEERRMREQEADIYDTGAQGADAGSAAGTTEGDGK
jgi:cytochrome c oxidase assembly factor CtaG/putative copper export protein